MHPSESELKKSICSALGGRAVPLLLRCDRSGARLAPSIHTDSVTSISTVGTKVPQHAARPFEHRLAGTE